MRLVLPWLAAVLVLIAFFWPAGKQPAETGPPPVRTGVSSRSLSTPESQPTTVAMVRFQVPKDLQETLTALRKTYSETETSPARIRLHGELERLWADNAPIPVLLHEVGDRTAPAEYRIFFSKLLRKVAKTHASDQAPLVAQALRGLIQSPEDKAEFRAFLAYSLIDIDEGDATVAAIASQLSQATEDDVASILVSALSRTTHPAAVAAIWEFAQKPTSTIDAFPLALEAAIAPLCYEADVPIDSLLHRMANDSRHPRLRAISRKGLELRKDL